MNSFNAILLLDYLALRKRQQETHLQILRNEEVSAERSYNLLFSYISYNQRSSTRTASSDEMTGILSSISNLTTRRSTPSLATRSTINRSTNTSGLWSDRFAPNPTPRPRHRRSSSIFTPTTHTWPSTTTHFTTTRTTLDDPPSPPTPAEIEIATLSCKFSDISTNQIMCPITRSTFLPADDILQIIHCNHIFKKNFLLIWLQEHNTCPICRHNITQNRPSVQNRPSI